VKGKHLLLTLQARKPFALAQALVTYKYPTLIDATMKILGDGDEHTVALYLIPVAEEQQAFAAVNVWRDKDWK
jgi:hypothetical protein